MTPGRPHPRIGSLCSGYEGLGMAVTQVLGGSLAWTADNDMGSSAVLTRFSGVPNLGDISAVDWTAVERPHIVTAGFPCFVAGTLVSTINGPVPIEELCEGDMVLTHERRYRPVTQTMRRTADQTLRVKVMGAPALGTTAEHPFYVRCSRDAEPEWVAVSELRGGMFAALPDTDAKGWDIAESQAARWYLVGRWLGDGWVVTYKRSGRASSIARRVHWRCDAAESEALEKAFAAAGIRPTRAPDRTAVKYVMQSESWARLLGDFGKYAHGKLIPEYVHGLPVDAQAALLRGWLDSDGDVKADGGVNGTTTSKALVIGMARIARTVLGKPVSVHEGGVSREQAVIEGRSVNERPWWNVRYYHGRSKVAFQSGGFSWVPVRSVSPGGGPAEVFNISVWEDESYVADGVVVHNCQDVSAAGRGAGLHGSRTGVWAHVVRAIAALRPGLVFLENVRGLLSARANCDLEYCPGCMGDDPDRIMRALGAVLGDLAGLGFDAEWDCVPASDAGACHQRKRVFILAWDAAAANSANAG